MGNDRQGACERDTKYMKILILNFLLLVSTFALAGDFSQIEEKICHRLSYVIRDTHGDDSWFKLELKEMNNDTNKLTEVLGRIADREVRYRRVILQELRKQGNKSALPICYKYLTDINCFHLAAWGILVHEGLTSNSVMKISEGLQRFKDTQPTFNVFRNLMHYASKEKDEGVRRLVVNEGIVYITGTKEDHTETLEKSLMRVDETYRLSKRRLGVLRSVRAVGLNKWNKEYVEKVIKELEAFPEEKLSE